MDPKPAVSSYERKLARQRQLELMEAAASGTAPAMELDVTSQFDTVDLRQKRNQESARKFLHDEDEEEDVVMIHGPVPPPAHHATTTTGSLSGMSNRGARRSTTGVVLGSTGSGHVSTSGGTATASILGPRPGYFDNRPSVNLMDHQTGVYSENEKPTSILGSMRNIIFATTSKAPSDDPDRYDAHDTTKDDFGGDVYLGDASLQQRRPNKGRRMSPIRAACCALRESPLCRRCCLAVMVLLFCFAIIYTARRDMFGMAGKHRDKVLRQHNSIRFNDIMDVIVANGISTLASFNADTNSPQYHALRWISYTDPARLEPSDPMLLQRYALVTFYYNSYIAFQKVAGKQSGVTSPLDDQFQGVPNPGWTRRDNWLSGQGICNWYGISCAPQAVAPVAVGSSDGSSTTTTTTDGPTTITKYDANSPVIVFNMTKNHVRGTIPGELQALTSMTAFDVSHNAITGTFPHQMGNMDQLQAIYMNNNALTGQLPQEMGFLRHVQNLRLSFNKLAGTIPSELNRLTELQSLQLNDNTIGGSIPSLSSLLQVEYMHLQNNNLTGPFPFSFARLKALKELNMENNRLSQQIPVEIQSLSTLEYLLLSNNQFSGPLEDHMFTRLTNLKQLSVRNNQITGQLPISIGELSSMTILELNDNQFGGTIPYWQHLNSLSILHLQNNQLQKSIPATVGNMTSLTELWLFNNNLAGGLPRELSQLTQLRLLYLAHNNLSGKIPSEYGNLNVLQTFRVFQNGLRGVVPEEVCYLKTTQRSLRYFEVDCTVTCSCCDKCYE